MARTVKNANLETRTARGRLSPRGKPYYYTLDPGLHIGYRKPRTGSGKWVVRIYAGNQDYTTDTIATADDTSDATFKDTEVVRAQLKETDVLTFVQAQILARRLRDQRSRTSAGIVGPYTVSDTLADYFTFLRSEGRPDYLVDATSRRAGALIEPNLGRFELSKLTTQTLRTWRDDQVRMGARIRVAEGETQRYREPEDEDQW